jgi:hypothetical protein
VSLFLIGVWKESSPAKMFVSGLELVVVIFAVVISYLIEELPFLIFSKGLARTKTSRDREKKSLETKHSDKNLFIKHTTYFSWSLFVKQR